MRLMLPLLLAGCQAGGERAIVDASRPEHFFDHPFPADVLRDEGGGIDLSGFPMPESELGFRLIDGWSRRLEGAAHGFANNGAIYLRFEGPLADLPETTAGDPDDPVLLVALDEPELLPLEVRFVADPKGDPAWAPHTLALAPRLGAPPRSGGRYAAVVMRRAGAAPADGWELPDEVADALEATGVRGRVAVATVFTVQDATGQLRQLVEDVDSRLGAWRTEPKRVVHLRYAQGTTPSGEEATVCTATLEDGAESVAYLAPLDEEEGTHEVDLLDDWPMAVYQAEIPTWNYQGLDDRPYMSPGVAHITDTERMTGWIDFPGGLLASAPEAEAMRITISIPLDDAGEPMEDVPAVLWDHGTGGHAYNAVQRRNVHDDGRALAEVLAAAGYAVVGRDAPLYGTRYPLLDEGHGGSLGYYNIVNLPAFRDNMRQTAVDGHVLKRFLEGGLELPGGSIDATRLRRFGHSLGSVTANLGLAADPGGFESGFLSGSGGVMTHYFLDTGLIGTFSAEDLALIFAVLQVEPPDEITPASVLGAALGVPDEAWEHIDRLHPTMTLFQWTMDPADAAAVARDEALPLTLLVGLGDLQVPNLTSYGLADALPDASAVDCASSWDYDPHYCLHREREGQDAFAAWLGR